MVSNASDDLPDPESPVIHHQPVAGNVYVDGFQVVRPGATDANEVHRISGDASLGRVENQSDMLRSAPAMKQNDSDRRPFGEADAPSPAMSSLEQRAVAALAGIFSPLRMLGLFMFLPVFSVYAHEYAGHTPLLIGVAIGIYGLTQGVFQIPLGILSDRFGRKPVIAAGLVVFVLGSVVAALSDGIWGIVAGRALQGMGAVAAAVMALASDLTGETHRTRVMAIIGAKHSEPHSFSLSSSVLSSRRRRASPVCSGQRQRWPL